MKRIAWLLGLMIGTVFCAVHLGAALADADETSVTVTVGPNADKGVGYGTFEGVKILTLTIHPQTGYKILTSECTDNAGTGLWYQASASDSEHVWKTYGVLPNFMTTESHAAIIHGTLAPISGTGGSGEIPFDVKVSDIDIDVDAMGRHADAIWTPTDPSTQKDLNDLEDKCEDGDNSGLAMPITNPGASLPTTFSENTGKALRVCINAKKAGSVAFSGMGSTLAIYRQAGGQQTKVTEINNITTSGLNEILYLHTCTGFTTANVTAAFTTTSESVTAAKDTVRIYLASNGYQLYVNTPATTDDYVPVEALGRVPVTVTRTPSDAAVDLKLQDNNGTNPILFYDASTGGTGVAEKTFTMAAGASSQTFWISGDAAGTGPRTIKLYEKNGQNWDEKKSLDVTVFNIQKIPLGGSANLSKYIIGKVYVPTKWGGTLNISGSAADLYYSDGTDLTVDMAVEILKGNFQLAGGSPYAVPKNQYGWYYVRIAATSPTAITATFQQSHTVAKSPWSCPWYPYADDQSPNLYEAGGCLAKYDTAYTRQARDIDIRNQCQPSGPRGHRVAQSTLRETDAEVTVGRDFNGNRQIEANIHFDFWNSNTKDFSSDGDTTDVVDASWWGHCTEATAAIISENEPSGSTPKNGVTFNADDKKGLLVALYHDFSIGYNSGDGILPHTWHGFLESRILGDDKMFACNIFFPDRGVDNQIWNYPIYSLVSADYKQKPNQSDEKVVEVTCEVKYWKSSANPPASQSLYYKYNVTYAGGVASSSQTSDWQDHPQAPANYKRPQSVWVPNVQTTIPANTFWRKPALPPNNTQELFYDEVREIAPAPQ